PHPSSHFLLFIFYSTATLRVLHSFPTRRSSDLDPVDHEAGGGHAAIGAYHVAGLQIAQPDGRAFAEHGGRGLRAHVHQPQRLPRSEEHTSELQSLAYLVCRLLLEKKKTLNNLPS